MSKVGKRFSHTVSMLNSGRPSQKVAVDRALFDLNRSIFHNGKVKNTHNNVRPRRMYF